VDEVGRGCLFGPVCAAAVILPARHGIRGLNDSKQLSAAEREAFDAQIRARALAFAVAEASVGEIERLNIYQATRLAMTRAVQTLHPAADFLLTDAMKLNLDLPGKSLIRGDARSHSIAAASILAKVHRDQLMRGFDGQYPGFGLARNKGYGTPEHLAGLEQLGPTPLHRRTFLPVRQLGLFTTLLRGATA
jgi:ribonuclease HII